MAENRDTYILPCPCGRNFMVQPRQAGETVRCKCGRDSTVPSMGEIRRLRPAEKPSAATATDAKWGGPQRFLVVAIALILLAGVIVLVLGYLQYTDDQWFANEVQRQRNKALHLRPWSAIDAYRVHFAQGIETPMEAWFQGRRERMAVGMVIAGLTGIAGVVFAAIGVVGLTRSKRS